MSVKKGLGISTTRFWCVILLFAFFGENAIALPSTPQASLSSSAYEKKNSDGTHEKSVDLHKRNGAAFANILFNSQFASDLVGNLFGANKPPPAPPAETNKNLNSANYVTSSTTNNFSQYIVNSNNQIQTLNERYEGEQEADADYEYVEEYEEKEPYYLNNGQRYYVQAEEEKEKYAPRYDPYAFNYAASQPAPAYASHGYNNYAPSTSPSSYDSYNPQFHGFTATSQPAPQAHYNNYEAQSGWGHYASQNYYSQNQEYAQSQGMYGINAAYGGHPGYGYSNNAFAYN